jgi:glycosyltransferase involved in cell wall biosynthesis
MKLVVVIPYFNEEKIIHQLLETVVMQKNKNFSLVLVDNNSTDKTSFIVKNILSKQSDFHWEIISELEKGTGAASDTGFRFAINNLGATHIARTDADCLLDEDWIDEIEKSFRTKNLHFLVGKILPKKEPVVTILDEWVSSCLVSISSIYGKITRMGKEFQYPYKLAAGNNLAISAQMYIQCGGFPRTSIDNTNEDDLLAESVRTKTKLAYYNKNMKVYNSLRRLKKYGYFKTLMWYKQRAYRPADTKDIDIR